MAAPPRERATPLFLSFRAEWMSREDEILAGKRMPTIGDRRRGHAAFRDSPKLDAQQQAHLDIDEDIHDDDTVSLLQDVIDLPTADACWAVYQAMGSAGDSVDAWLWHAALRGHPQAVAAWSAHMTTARDRDRIGHMHGVAVAIGMLSSLQMFGSNSSFAADDVAEIRDRGMGILRRISDTLVEWDVATDALASQEPDPEQDPDAAFLRLVEEDRPEIFAPASTPEAPGLVVIPQVLLLRPDSKHRKDIIAAAMPHAGKHLPFVGGCKLAEARAMLRDSHPHCHVQTDRILNLQAGKPFLSTAE